MDRIARAVEPSMGYRHEIPAARRRTRRSAARCRTPRATSPRRCARRRSSCRRSPGRTASSVARLRPQRPIIALTHIDWAMRQMALEWGVTPILIPECGDVEELWTTSVDAAREAGLDRRRRPRRHHRGHAGEHARLDERDQGRHRLSGGRARRRPGERCEGSWLVRRSRVRPSRGRRPARSASSAAGSRWARSCSSRCSTTGPLKAYVDARGELAQKRAVVQQLAGREARGSSTGSGRRRRSTRSRARRARSATSARASTSSSSRASTSGGSASGPA